MGRQDKELRPHRTVLLYRLPAMARISGILNGVMSMAGADHRDDEQRVGTETKQTPGVVGTPPEVN